MNCPQCGERNPSTADRCLHCNAALKGPLAAGPEPQQQASSDDDSSLSTPVLVGGLLFIALVAALVLKGEEIRNWFWTTDRTVIKCVPKTETMLSDRYTPENGWYEIEVSVTSPRYEPNHICFQKNMGALKDGVDERFQPESVRESGKQ